MKKVLGLSCHADDLELGCGATIHQLTQRGYEVCSAVFSIWHPQDSSVKLLNAWHHSMSTLGIIKKNRFVFNYPNRNFHIHRQEILDELINFKKAINPDYVFTPSMENIHQDHVILGTEALRAFRDTNLWNYELQWSEINFKSLLYVPIFNENLAAKVKALSHYEPRYESKRPYFSKDFIYSLAILRGIQIGVEFAEAFNIQRCIQEF